MAGSHLQWLRRLLTKTCLRITTKNLPGPTFRRTIYVESPLHGPFGGQWMCAGFDMSMARVVLQMVPQPRPDRGFTGPALVILENEP
jgi:hypothetical protein